MSSRLFLLDGSAVFYRAYFAFIKNPLINSKGQNTSAVYGFLNTLLKILMDERPEYLAIVFDTGQPTFRHELFKEYKATREKMPDDLRDQLPLIRQMADCLGIPILELNGYEADDIIGTLSVKGERAGHDVFMVSGDKDFMQLITEKVKMYAVGKSGMGPEITSFPEVEKKFGCTPDKVIDVLGLMGDTSDNVPGVEGIGPKTASKLIAEYGSIEGIYEQIDSMKKSKNKERLIEQKERALLSKELVTIHLDVPIEYDFESMKLTPPDMEQTKQFLEDVEFTKMMRRIEDYVKTIGQGAPKKEEPVVYTPVEKKYITVASLAQFNNLLETIKSGPTAFDTETTGLESLNCELVGFSFSNNAHTGFYLPCNDTFFEENQTHILHELKLYFEDDSFLKIGQNIKYDALVLSQYDIRVRGIYFDTMIAHYLLHPGGRNHGLDDMAKAYLGYDMVPISELIGKGRNQITMDQVDIEKVAFYAAEDADITYQIYTLLKPQLEENDLWSVFADIEMPLVSTLIEVEKNGVHLDKAFLEEYSKTLQKEIEERLEKIHSICDQAYFKYIPEKLQTLIDAYRKKNSTEGISSTEDLYAYIVAYADELTLLASKTKLNPILKDVKTFASDKPSIDAETFTETLTFMHKCVEDVLKKEGFNLNSPKQLGVVLFEALEIHKDLGKKRPKKTKTGQYSTAESELEKYKDHEVISFILEYRELTKLKSTYVDALPKLINPKTGAIHTNFNQTIAATGRLSSTDPNLQNIPIRTKLGRQIRKAFIPPEGKILVAADYSQIELRMVAHIANDSHMLSAFKFGQDIHKSTAALMFKVPLEDVTPEMRRKAKEINFGIIYGISQWGLASRIGIDPMEAQMFIDDYFKQFPNIKNFMMNTISEARETQCVKTISGRIRQIPEINSDNRKVKEGAERVAINTPIQGSAADLIKIAMINIQNEIEERGLNSQMILQVHDELVFEADEAELDTLKALIKDKMEHAMDLNVALKTDVGIGKNWLEAH